MQQRETLKNLAQNLKGIAVELERNDCVSHTSNSISTNSNWGFTESSDLA